MEVTVMREKYKETLTDVIETIQASGAKLIIGGPIILGEGKDKNTVGNDNKRKMLDMFREYNMKIALEHGVDYVDFRKGKH